MPVNHRELNLEIRLVEVICMGHEGPLEARLEGEQRIRAHEHGHAASAAGGAGRCLSVQGDVRSHHDGIAAVPRAGFDPVHRVEQGARAAVACVDRVDALQAGVASWFEQLGEHGLYGLGLVDQRFGADLQTTDRLRVDVVFMEQRGDSGKCK